MKYNIEITEAAQRDFENIYTYISENLKNRKAAIELIKLIDKNIKLLSDMPQAYPLVKDEYLQEKGFRFLTVKNYIVFYTVNLSEKKVYIVRVLHGRRNWMQILLND